MFAARWNTKVGFALVAFGILATACGPAQDKQSSSKQQDSVVVVRVGFRLTLADIAPIVLKHSNRLDRGAIRIVPVAISSPAQALQELAGGGLDAMAGLTLEPVLNSVDSTGISKLRIYYMQVDSAGGGWISVVSAPKTTANSLRDLAGKTVGALPTNQARFLVRQTLSGGGVPDAAIRVGDYNPATPLNGLLSGEQAAIWGLEPALSRAEALGGKRLVRGPISALVFKGAEVPMSASVVRREFLAAHPEAYEALIAATEEAIKLIDQDLPGTRAIFAATEYGGLDSTVYRLLQFPVMRSVTTPIAERQLDDVITWLRRNGHVNKYAKASALLR